MATAAASAATTVLPEPTSPCSSRCIGWSRARSARDLGADAPLRGGQREGQRRQQPAVQPLRTATTQRRRAPQQPLAPCLGLRQLLRQQLLELQALPGRVAAVLDRIQAGLRRRVVQELQGLAQARQAAGQQRRPAALRAAARAPAPRRRPCAGRPAAAARWSGTPASAPPAAGCVRPTSLKRGCTISRPKKPPRTSPRTRTRAARRQALLLRRVEVQETQHQLVAVVGQPHDQLAPRPRLDAAVRDHALDLRHVAVAQRSRVASGGSRPRSAAAGAAPGRCRAQAELFQRPRRCRCGSSCGGGRRWNGSTCGVGLRCGLLYRAARNNCAAAYSAQAKACDRRPHAHSRPDPRRLRLRAAARADRPAPRGRAQRVAAARRPRRVPADRAFRDLPALLQPGDLLVFNDTRVIKARLFGEKASGGAVEALVERVLPGHEVLAHLRASKSPSRAAGCVLRRPSMPRCSAAPARTSALFRPALSGRPAGAAAGATAMCRCRRTSPTPTRPRTRRATRRCSPRAPVRWRRRRRRCISTRPCWPRCTARGMASAA